MNRRYDMLANNPTVPFLTISSRVNHHLGASWGELGRWSQAGENMKVGSGAAVPVRRKRIHTAVQPSCRHIERKRDLKKGIMLDLYMFKVCSLFNKGYVS